ncbi:hypothetical protein [Isoptericola rhizosphaerae]|uniref:hypothetical protein n=1 Tax=Isoptericola rhizosphaerae TaxID=3377837 RepID=UPI00383A2D1F
MSHTLVLFKISEGVRPPLDLFDSEKVFAPHRARLEEINAAEGTFASRERARYADHEKAVTAWRAEAEAAALAGQPQPADPPPEWQPTPGGEVFERERSNVRQDIVATWCVHAEEILDRNLATATAEVAAATDAHADATAALKVAADRLSAAESRVRVLNNSWPRGSGRTPRDGVDQSDLLMHDASRTSLRPGPRGIFSARALGETR